MNLKSLKVFCDIVVRRSFSKAAEDNGISQSGASQVVGQLEQRLGVQLLDRSSRPLVPTREGQIYFDGCRRLLDRYAALEDEVRTLHDEVAGRVRVAAIYSVGLHHMSLAVREFTALHPRANVRLEYLHPDRVLESVESGHADLGLVSYPRGTRTLDAEPWREEPFVLACAPGHALAGLERVRLEDLDRRAMVGFDPDLVIRHELDKALAGRGVEPDVVMEFDNIETIKRAVEIDSGVALLPAPTVGSEVAAGRLCAVPLEVDPPLHRPLGIVRVRGKPLPPTAARFLEFLRGQPGLEPAAPPATAVEPAARRGRPPRARRIAPAPA
ncbi:MAG: LysR family transcriptional regulator [Planctomycetaceae bacterium]